MFEDASLKIVNVIGEELKKEKLNSKKQQIDLSGLPDGIYFLGLIQNNNILLSKKIIKQ